MTSDRRVLVYGAAGHTGRFVVDELQRRGLTPVLGGRSPLRLSEMAGAAGDLEVRTATVDDPRQLAALVTDVDAVLNCAGPFLETALPVARAAVAAGAHYLDVTAEQPVVQALYHQVDRPARDAAVAVVPAMAFYGGLADLMVTAALRGREHADAVEVAIGLDHWWPTAGTRITGERNTAVRQRISGGELVPLDPPARTGSWTFPPPLGRQEVVDLTFSEAITLHRHLRIGGLTSYLNTAPLAELRDDSTPPPTSADESGRSAQRFVVDVAVESAGERARLTVSGQDIYASTAPLIAAGVARLLDGRAGATGAIAPGQAFDATQLLDELASGPTGFTMTSAAT